MDKCHFCEKEKLTVFLYDLRNDIDMRTRGKVPVCNKHFNILYDSSYTLGKSNHLPVGQREYISVKRLESALNVKNPIQFK